jgi:CRP/FNR family transcriptional regulator
MPRKRAHRPPQNNRRMNAQAVAPPCEALDFETACTACRLRDLCLPAGLSMAALQQIDALVVARRALRRGDTLFRRGDAFDALFAVRTGFFKTCMPAKDGREQVIGFQMPGELLGLDGIGDAQHGCDAVALEDSQVCVMRYAQIEMLAQACTELQPQLRRVLSREIVRDRAALLRLGGMRAEERLAAFLLDLAQRQQARGFSPSTLRLRMTREEIGSCLGLQLETVSRCFSKLQQLGLLSVRQRHVVLLDTAALRRLLPHPGA